MTSSTPKGKGQSVLGAITDFLILVLLIAGAGFGGYYWGTTQRMAPVQMVPPGTPGAISADKAQMSPPVSTDTKAVVTTVKTEQATTSGSKDLTSTSTAPTPDGKPADTKPAVAANNTKTASSATETPKQNGPTKYWIVSTGSDYIGYQITVKVNGTPVDGFFGPGKTINVTKQVKHGENDITFDAKNVGANYNKHKGDAKAELTLQLVSGPIVQEEFDKSAVLASYTRNAAETEDFSDTKHFVKN